MAFSTHDIVPDSPTNNFATLNLITPSSGTYSDGNLRIAADDTDVHLSTIACPIGLISYFETIPVSTSNREIVGFSTGDSAYVIYYYNWQNDDTRRIWESVNGTGSYISGHLNNDITGKLIGLSLDLSGPYINLKMYVDGTLLVNQTTNTLVSSITKPIFPLVQSASGAFTFYTNFGQDPTFAGAKSPTTTYTDANGIGAFYYQPPTDALALCTANLPDFTPTVTGDVPQDYFKAVTYTGNGTGQSITGVGVQPDLVWIKSRNVTANHALFDSIRGVGNVLQPNTTLDAQTDNATLTSFDSNGFSLGNATGSYVTNTSTYTFVAWCWKAGGAPTADNSNTSGAMTANSVSLNGTLQSNYTPAGSPTIYPKRMSINTDAGFSIVKYNGNGTSDDVNYSIPHGLSYAPDVVIVKNLDLGSQTSGISWPVLFTNIGAFEGLDGSGDINNPDLNSNWSGSYPNANTFFVRRPSSSSTTNRYRTMGDYNYIAYCWHSVEGYSKFGSYTGNGSPDGPFVYCGFRPAWVMIKQSSSSGEGWYIVDTARDTYNAMGTILIANSAGGDNTSQYPYVDYVSNGFKLRSGWQGVNATNGIYIFMAFAEQPFKFSNAR